MTQASEDYADEYEEYDEFDDDADERGLSGLAVLIMGIVMIGAFLSVVWIAYQQGIKTGQGGVGGAPYVAADPEPIKIETAEDTAPLENREVYDVFDGEEEEPVTVLAEGPEEPVDRTSQDTIGALAADAEDAAAAVSDEVKDRLASLAEEDAAALDEQPVEQEPEPVTVTPLTTVSVPPAPELSTRAAGAALSGSHVVQIGAFRSDEEAQAQWSRLQSKLGDYLDGKSQDIERADLGERGVYHRLRIGPFKSSDEAKTYCVGLKERGQDCLVKSI